MTNLKYGSRGDAVKTLQTNLNKLGYNCGTADGVFGVKTRTAVLAFQKAKGLEVDGVVGAITLAAIDAAFGKGTSSSAAPKPTVIAGTDAATLKAKAEKMLDIIEKRVGDEYIYGTQGETTIVSKATWSASCFPDYTTAARKARMIKYAAANPMKANGEPLRCEDCSGLFWAAENIVELPLAASDIDDATAEGLYKAYCIPIKKSELRPLDLVFSGNPISHVAVVGRNGKIYEAAGSDIGVVVNDSVDDRTVKSIYGGAYGCAENYTKGAWTSFGRLRIFKDIEL